MSYDPHRDNQFRTHRQDPTGRYIGFKEQEPGWHYVVGGVVFACILAVLFSAAI